MVIHYVHFCLLMSCGEMFADMEHLLVVPLPMTVVIQLSQNVLVVMVVFQFSGSAGRDSGVSSLRMC